MGWVDIRHAWGRRETQKERAHLSDLGIDMMIIIVIIIVIFVFKKQFGVCEMDLPGPG
jgi:hypothetical protein